MDFGGRDERERKRNMRSFAKGQTYRSIFDEVPKNDRRTLFNALVKKDNLNPEWFQRGLEEESSADDEDAMEIVEEPASRKRRVQPEFDEKELKAKMQKISERTYKEIMSRPQDAKYFIDAITLVPDNSLPYVGIKDLADAKFALQKATEFLKKFGTRFQEIDAKVGGHVYLNGMNDLNRISIELKRQLMGKEASDFAMKVTVHLGGTTVDDRRNKRQLEGTNRGPNLQPLLYAEEDRHAHFEPFNWKASRVMDAELIRGPEDIPNFMSVLRKNIAEKIISNQLFTRESSAVRVVSVDSAKLNIAYTSQRNLRIGAWGDLPEHLMQRYLNAKGIYASKKRGKNVNNMCFFQCLARHQAYIDKKPIPRRVSKASMQPFVDRYFQQFPNDTKTKVFQGVKIQNLPRLEQLYNVRIYLYKDVNQEEQEKQVKIVPYQGPTLPKSNTTTDLHLLLVHNCTHCLYIDPKKLNLLTRGGWSCIQCKGVYSRQDVFKKHSCRKHVKELIRRIKPNGVPLVFDPKRNARWEMLQEHPAFHYTIEHYAEDKSHDIQFIQSHFIKEWTVDHVTFFDLETVEREIKLENGDVVFEQVPFHASVMSTLSDKPYNLYNKDPKMLVKELLQLLLTLGRIFKHYMGQKLKVLYNESDLLKIVEMAWQRHKEKYWGPFPNALEPCLTKPILEKEKEKFYTKFNKTWFPPHTVLGFNSGRFDIPAMKKWGFFTYLKTHDCKERDLFSIKQGNCYSQVRSDTLDFKDLMKFLAAGISFDKACKAFQTETQKMHFCHDWLKSLDQLESTTCLPPREAFYNTMKKQELSEEAYAECQKAWKDYDCKTMLDYLRAYNECDVIPGVQLAKKLMEMYANKFNIDCFTDATGAPRLSSDACYHALNQKIRSSYDGNNNWMRQKKHRKAEPFQPTELLRRIALYEEQDSLKHRPVPVELKLKEKDVIDILEQDGYKCHYCYNPLKDGNYLKQYDFHPSLKETTTRLSKGEYNSWTLDRKSSLLPHTRLNCVACCLLCNRRKKNIGYERFLELEFIRRRDLDCGKRMINVPIDPRVIDILRSKKVGGFAASFMLKAEAGKTVIDVNYPQKEFVQMVMEIDKTSAYPEVMAEPMPAGPETYNEDVDVAQFAMDLLEKHPRNFIGFALVDIEVPAPMCYEPKYQRWPPFHVNTMVPFEALGEYTKEALKKFHLEKHVSRQRRMVSLLKVEKALFTTEQLRDYVIDRKFQLNKVHATIIYKNAITFKPFITTLANMRRVADVDKKFEAMGQIAKILMNSLFGRQMMDERRFEQIKYMPRTDYKKLIQTVNKRQFLEMEKCDEDLYEAHMRQDVRNGISVPMQIGVWVLCQSKLKMTQFIYDVLSRYWDYKDWNIVGSDTDSFHIASAFPTAKTFFHPSAVRAKYREEYSKLIYGSSEPCEALGTQFSFKEGNTVFCFDQFSKKTPGLFKVEAENKKMYFPCAKTYITVDSENKVSKTTAKGAQNQRNRYALTEENFIKLTDDQEQLLVENKHFRYNKLRGQQESSVIVKAAARPINCKRRVLSNGIHTEPLQADMIIEHVNQLNNDV